jgi:hypothetical protein
VGQSASYHVEVVVPPGCQIRDPRIMADDGRAPAKVHLMQRRATVYLLRRGEAQAGLRFDLGQAVGYFLVPAMIIAWLAVGAFVAGTAVVWAGGTPESTASAILLSGLGAVSGLVIRSEEAALTSAIHSWLRFVLTGVAMTTLAGAAAIAFGARAATLGIVWSVLLGLAVLGAGILTWAVREQKVA